MKEENIMIKKGGSKRISNATNINEGRTGATMENEKSRTQSVDNAKNKDHLS